jgi:hypothetical protein
MNKVDKSQPENIFLSGPGLVLPQKPWANEWTIGGLPQEIARRRWRDALDPIVKSMCLDLKRPQSLTVVRMQELEALVRAITLSDPSRVADFDTIPVHRIWSMADGRMAECFNHVQCSLDDRTMLLHWLGRFVARVNWQDSGESRGAAPMAVTASSRLMTTWAAIAWHDRLDIPDWCKEVRRASETFVYPENAEANIYRTWHEARTDMQTFLKSWSEERLTLGRKRPRKGKDQRHCAAAKDMSYQLLLMRALEVQYPGEIDKDDIDVMKTMGEVINAKMLNLEMPAILRSMEDRAYLEKGLQSISDLPCTDEADTKNCPDKPKHRTRKI